MTKAQFKEALSLTFSFFVVLFVMYFIMGCTTTHKIIPLSNITMEVTPECTTEYVGFEEPLTERDEGAIKQAKKRCAEIYPDAPCLKKLQRMEDGVYRAICGT
jgi:hypothetical protein